METKDIVKSTFRELKNNLPVGLVPKPEWGFEPKNNSFKFREWGFEEEEKIAKLKNEESSSGQFAAQVLDLMLLELGGVEWEKLDEKKLLVMNQMFMSDIMYMYIYLRINAMGGEFCFLNLTCPFCNHEYPEYVVDLNDLDVDCLADDMDKDEIIDYKLIRDFTFTHVGPDKKQIEEKIEKLKISRSKWSVMDKITGETAQNEGLAKKHILNGSIEGFNDSIGYVDGAMLGMLKKIDIERLHRLITKHNLGPAIVVTGKCKSCGKKWMRQINWSYDYFFGSSSLPEV